MKRIIEKPIKPEYKPHRTFKTKEIAEMLGLTTSYINMLARKLGVEYHLTKTGKIQNNVYDYAGYAAIKQHVDAIRGEKEKQTEKKTTAPKLTLEELQKLHPLVTNPKWFNINQWPDTVPNCMEND